MIRKRFSVIVMWMGCLLSAHAQESTTFDTSVVDEMAAVPYQDSLKLSLPLLTMRGTIPLLHYPFSSFSYFSDYADWSLHRGMNASLGAAAILGFGNNAGSGFANSVSLMYANNITPQLSFAIGGYASFLEYGGHKMNDAGMTAIINYRFDDHWEAAVFAQKSMVQPRIPPHLYWMREDVGDKIGASIRYNFNPSFSVSLSVWDQRRNYSTYRPGL